MRAILLAAAALLVPGAAHAWDGPDMWYAAATGPVPGGGGIVGTGGQRDHGITCLDCHQDRVETDLGVTFTFTPPLDETGGQGRFALGRRYRVDVRMVNERLGPPCEQYMAHHNVVAANFELASGAPAGVLESDSGQTQAACPPAFTNPGTGTTALYGDCEVVFPRRGENLTAWTFFWTAPSAAASVELFYGAVDGDCGMTSFDDAVVVGKRTLMPAPSAAAFGAPSRRSAWPIVPVVVTALAGLGLLIARRRRSPA